MPSTHAIFEHLVADKPPLQLDIADLVSRGERAARVRRGAQLTGALSVLAMGALGVAGVAATTSRHPAPTTAEPAGPGGFAFTSAHQIEAADRRVVAAMLRRTDGRGKVTLSDPTVVTAGTRRTIHEVSYSLGKATVTLLENVSAPGGNTELINTGLANGSQASPCDVPHHPQTTQSDGSTISYAWYVDCARTALPDGAVLWTMRVQWTVGRAPDPGVQAIVEAADGSSVFAQTASIAAGAVAPGTLTRAEVGDLAISLGRAWQGSPTPAAG